MANAFQDFVAGWFGGITGLLVGHPFDTVKARLQTDGLDGTRTYKGTYHCVSHIIKTEGARALYKGMLSPMLGMAAINAIVFGVQAKVINTIQPGRDLPKIRNSFFAGAVAGGAQCVICCPVELIKLRMQIQKEPTQLFGKAVETTTKKVYSNPWDVARKVHRQNGLLGLFKGTVPTLWREIPAFGVYFACYDLLCQWIIRRKDGMGLDDLSPLALCLAGGFSGIAAWVVSYPFDVVKSRIQVDGMMGSGDLKYRGMVDCFRQSYREPEGIGVFAKGLNSTLIRAFPVNAVTFTTVALILRYWRNGSIQVD